MRRRALRVIFPLLLLFMGGVFGQRWLIAHSAQEEDKQADTEARQLVLQEFRKELEGDAYTSAQKYVRSHLLPENVASSAQIRELTLTHTQPHRYKIRGEMEWQQADGESVRRRVEADLQHGPLDKNWYLVDTEFLPFTPAN